MNEFVVEICETLQRQIVILAEDEKDALQTVEDLYDCCSIVLNADDCVDRNFLVKKAGEK